MVSTKLLGLVNQHCTKIFQLRTTGSAVFGGVPIVLLLGDFYQFPPIGGDPLWTSKSTQHFNDVEMEGWNTWMKFNQAIILTESLKTKRGYSIPRPAGTSKRRLIDTRRRRYPEYLYYQGKEKQRRNSPRDCYHDEE